MLITCKKNVMYTNCNIFWLSFTLDIFCRNLNIGFTTKCEVQGPMRLRMCLGVKHILTNGGECKWWTPMTPKCTPILGIAFVRELWMFRALVGTCKKTPNWGLDFYCKDPNGIMCFYAQNQICVMNQVPNDFGMFGIV